MIIKKSEWDELKKNNLSLYAKNAELITELNILRKSKKSETIIIKTHISTPYKNDWEISTTSELDLSFGIRQQCFRILSKITEQVRGAFNSTVVPEIKSEVGRAVRIENEKFSIKIKSFQKKLSSLPWYTSKRKILKLFNTEML